MEFKRKDLSDELLRELYTAMLRPRMIEEKMLSLLRQGKISKWFSGIGQEAIAVSAAIVLEEDEWIFPMHRNLGVFTVRGIPLSSMFSQWQGKAEGFTKGRDRSFHFGTKAHRIWGMISHLGPQLSLASGIALAHKLAGEKKLSIAFTGEGGTSEGEFHEALNVASVWKLPVIFIIENNGYGLSTPVSEQYACKSLADRGLGYGMKSHSVDGNNVLEIYALLSKVAKEIRSNPEPVLIECRTFRMRGHEEASGTKYVPQELMDEWAQKDPIMNYRNFLLDEKVLESEEIDNIEDSIKKEIKKELKIAEKATDVDIELHTELRDVFAPYKHIQVDASGPLRNLRFVDAVSEGLNEVMTKWDKAVLMGQDIADYGGVFKITEGFIDRYGLDRVRNTPLCESAVIGIALGMSMKSYKPMVEMQFADFVSCGFNQIVNNLAKIHYRWGHNADVVIRMPTGGSVGAGPFHSQSNEAWFAHTPGLKIVYPSNPGDAKGLLIASFEDPNPVLFFEHKALYRSLEGDVAEGYYNTEIGKAKCLREGNELSIITYGLGVHWAVDAVKRKNIDADILDLRTIVPLDYEAIESSVRKTGKAIVLHEDTLFGGIGAEISAYITEHLFESLDGPVIRVASLDTPIPFNSALEKQFLANNRLDEALDKLKAY